MSMFKRLFLILEDPPEPFKIQNTPICHHSPYTGTQSFMIELWLIHILKTTVVSVYEEALKQFSNLALAPKIAQLGKN